MGRPLWIGLGILSILAAVSLIMGTPERLAELPPDQHPRLIHGVAMLSGLCGVIAIACFFPQSYPVTLRILGLVGIAGCGFNLEQGLEHRDFSQFPALLTFWIPGCVYLIWRGRLDGGFSRRR